MKISNKMATIRQSMSIMGEYLTVKDLNSVASESYSEDSNRRAFSGSTETEHLRTLLDSEREKTRLLERRLSHKNKLLEELTKSQEELCSSVEKLQIKIKSLKKELSECKEKSKKETSASTTRFQRFETENIQLIKEIQEIRQNGFSDCIFIRKLKDLVKLEDLESVYVKIQHLQNTHAKFVSARNFVKKLGQLMLEISPNRVPKPSTSQIWNWLMTTLDNYMKLKQASDSHLIERLADLLKTPPTNLYTKILSLNEKHSSNEK